VTSLCISLSAEHAFSLTDDDSHLSVPSEVSVMRQSLWNLVSLKSSKANQAKQSSSLLALIGSFALHFTCNLNTSMHAVACQEHKVCRALHLLTLLWLPGRSTHTSQRSTGSAMTRRSCHSLLRQSPRDASFLPSGRRRSKPFFHPLTSASVAICCTGSDMSHSDYTDAFPLL